MRWDRRKFLQAVATGSLALPFATTLWGSDLLASQESPSSDSDALLDELERTAFEFFWNECDLRTGLVRDRANADGVDARITASIAATGFGLTALCIGQQRK